MGLHCDQCDFCTEFLETLQNHAEETHPIPRRQDRLLNNDTKLATAKRYSSNQDLDHIDKLHPEIRGKLQKKKIDQPLTYCDVCGKGMVNKISLSRHRCIQPKTCEKPSCDSCQKCFRQKSFLEQHNCLVPTRPYACEICEHKSQTLHALRLHIGRVHFNLGKNELSIREKPKFNCEQCFVKYTKKNRFQQHKCLRGKIPKSEWYACDFCSYSSPDSCYLPKHMKTHQFGLRFYQSAKRTPSEARNFVLCETCSFAARNPSQLLLHVARKHGVVARPKLICEICGNSYVEKRFLKNHLSRCLSFIPPPRSEPKRRYGCEPCSIVWASKSGLENHVIRAHTTKSYAEYEEIVKSMSCEKCGKSYADRDSMAKHIQRCGSYFNVIGRFRFLIP